jgi:hypothetical protein
MKTQLVNVDRPLTRRGTRGAPGLPEEVVTRSRAIQGEGEPMLKRFHSVAAAAMVMPLLLGTAVTARADAVLDWNVTMMTTLAGLSPFATQRYAAITQLAVFEAVNAITGDYEPYLGTMNAAPGASADAAVAVAAHDVLRTYFPAKAAALDAALAASLSAIPESQAKAEGMSVGAAAASAMIVLRANDGSAAPLFYVPPAAAPGQWIATPSCPPAGGVNLHWGKVTPFGVPDVTAFRVGPPPALISGEYAKDYAELRAVGGVDSVRPQDRTDVAQFYAMFGPATWANAAARQAAAAQGRSLSDNAHALAFLNMALNDASVAVFDSKYYYNFWRPETAIHAGATDGNHKTEGDSAFAPFITAPCFPGYPSNHGTASSAAAEVLQRVYGPSGHDITFSNPALPGVVLHYTTFKRIVDDVDDARVYGGIHFRFDQEAGGRQGQRIGEYIYKERLRPVHP